MISRALGGLGLMSAALGVAAFATMAAAAGESSVSTAIKLDIPQVDSVGLSAFAGSRGRATSGAAGGFGVADPSDPDGVGARVSTVLMQSQTSGNPNPPAWDARTDLTTLSFVLTPRARPLLRITTLNNYARCAPPAQVQTQVHVNGASVLGTPVGIGTTTLTATGSQLGLAEVATAELTVTLKAIEIRNGSVSAEARLVVTFEGILRDADGNSLHQGTLATLTLGDVRATCGLIPTPSPTPTAQPTITPTSRATPMDTPTPTPTLTPTPTSATATPTQSPTGEPSPSASAHPTDASDRDVLPFSGAAALRTIGPLAGLLVFGGGIGLGVARWMRERR